MQLRDGPFDLLQTSPRERAVETAEAIAQARAVAPPQAHEALDEVDFGRWAGINFAMLARDPQWRRWNESRGDAVTPEGESMREVTARIVGHMDEVARARPEGTALLVTHAEVIRAALLHHLGLEPGDWARIEVAPASVSRVRLDHRGVQVLGINEGSAAAHAELHA
jgi:broad specificity phosphatase PhoE